MGIGLRTNVIPVLSQLKTLSASAHIMQATSIGQSIQLPLCRLVVSKMCFAFYLKCLKVNFDQQKYDLCVFNKQKSFFFITK